MHPPPERRCRCCLTKRTAYMVEAEAEAMKHSRFSPGLHEKLANCIDVLQGFGLRNLEGVGRPPDQTKTRTYLAKEASNRKQLAECGAFRRKEKPAEDICCHPCSKIEQNKSESSKKGTTEVRKGANFRN